MLQYHLHISGGPLTNEDTGAGKYYDDEVRETPAILFNGSSSPGQRRDGIDEGRRNDDYRASQGHTGTTSPIKLTAQAAQRRQGPGKRCRRRADAGRKGSAYGAREEVARYTGGNQIRFHHHVVRDMPGGPKGIALTQKTGKQELGIDLSLLRGRINKYLNESAKDNLFPVESRPLDLKNLYLVAFVQNDENKEVLQSVQVKVSDGDQ